MSATSLHKMGDYTFDEDGMPVLRDVAVDKYADEADITNIFDINGDGYDVTLSLANGNITWTSVNPGGQLSTCQCLVTAPGLGLRQAPGLEKRTDAFYGETKY
ncbi:hypothetical protein KUTeg_008828 [Tegillarca granosa]|uniref:Uncharacterized protein n=1 Tax=Tegillarca granosa TaxID=220873 RepID=A0ABQ9FCT5_TEGGR|nr:hypothetical protein KUTeg_008828 [Tegillarca granosa]